MTRRQLVSSPGIMTAWISVGLLRSAEAFAFAEPKLDPLIADIVGEWQITYTNEAVRIYKFDPKGIATFEAEGRTGQVRRKSEALLLAFTGDEKQERLTMGVDGRLFVEHFLSRDDLIRGKAGTMGIGIRRK